MKRHINIPIFVPHNGCPHDCIFCNQKKIAGATSSFNENDVRQQIENYLSSANGVQHIEIAFFGGSFTGIPLDEQKAYLDLAVEYIQKHDLDGIRMSTRPDMISTETMDFLSQYPITVIELGVQSMCQEVLDASYRGHTVKDVYRASSLIRRYGISLGHQMMLGLPKDTLELSLETAGKLIAIEPDIVRIYPTLVIKDTALADLYNEGTYEPFDLETTIKLSAELSERFEEAGIEVVRVGLQTTEQIQPGRDVIAGPWHPAIGQLVDERRWTNFILNFIKDKHDPIVIEASQKLYQTLIGHKKGHMDIWNNHVPVVQIRLNLDVPEGMLKIDDEFVRRFEQHL